VSQFALVIGTTFVGETDLPRRPESEANAQAMADCLRSLEISVEPFYVLMGNRATRIGCESRLKKLLKNLQSGDTLWLYYSGYALTHEAQSYLLCADSDPDDLETTAWNLAEILEKIRHTGARTFAMFDLSVPPTTWEQTGELGWEEGNLREIFDAESADALLCANLYEGISYVNPERGLSVWTERIGEGLAGAAVYPLTAKRLFDYIQAELPKALRKLAESQAVQSPALLGAENFVWRDAPPGNVPQPSSQIDAAQLKRIVFRGVTRQRLKDLPFISKGQKLPDNAGPYAQRWLAKLCEPTLKQEIEDLYNAVREELGFKRKELEAGTTEEGYGYIRTPQFDYSVCLALDPDDVSQVIWRREVGHFSESAILRSPSFRKVFGAYLDELTFDFSTPLEVEALVDRIEERNPKGVKVRVAGDGSSCEITITGFKGVLKVDRKRIVISSGAGTNPESLLEQFFRFQNQFNQPLAGLKG
jgi:hypothetical protein